MGKQIKDLGSDIAPSQGRKALERWQGSSYQDKLAWKGSPFSLWGVVSGGAPVKEHTIRLHGRILSHHKVAPAVGWIEVESVGAQKTAVEDLFLVGTRPLPQESITCLCRCPIDSGYLVAGTRDARLLLLDARLSANLREVAGFELPAPVMSLVCCGKYLLGLEEPAGKTLFVIDLIAAGESLPTFVPAGHIALPEPLAALAENDLFSVWGLTDSGVIYQLQLTDKARPVQKPALALGKTMTKAAQLDGRGFNLGQLAGQIKRMVQGIKQVRSPWRGISFSRGRFLGIAYDGQFFWTFRQSGRARESRVLLQYDGNGNLMGSFVLQPEASISSLNYIHNHLLVLDAKHQQLHQIHLVDTMEPVASLAPLNHRHPGYLPGGIPTTGGIHDLCLLYVGGEGSKSVHRYDLDKLMPVVGYITPTGVVQDSFMDGFLMLAQYSPLLNGRSFGVDLSGNPSRKEDWIALFEEYFHPEANLQALEECAKEIRHRLDLGKGDAIKVVLGIPTPDRRCTAWDDDGFSLAEADNRVEVTRWAIKALIERWGKAHYRHLLLAGFYYMTEQGAWNDPVIHIFPRLCRQYGLRSFAIPGITSAWITEFTRAGFDAVALQSSHAFWQPSSRPRRYLLKCAGRIAREFGMGMEVEIPYDVLTPDGGQRLRDYLDMAHIQGWAGAFKAYFQSYNLIKTLAESDTPVYRKLYDDLYSISRLARLNQNLPAQLTSGAINVACQGTWICDMEPFRFRLNLEGHRGELALTGLSVE